MNGVVALNSFLPLGTRGRCPKGGGEEITW